MKLTFVVCIAVLMLAACVPSPTATPLLPRLTPTTLPTLTPAPTLTATATIVPSPTPSSTATPTPLPTSTTTPTPKPTLSPEKVGGLASIPLPSQDLIEQGIKTGVIRQKVEAGQLTFEVKDNLNRPGTKIVFGRDPATNDVVLATRLNPNTNEYVWYVAGLRDLADAIGLRVGASLSDYMVPSAMRGAVDQVVVNEFNTAIDTNMAWVMTEKTTQGVFDFSRADATLALAQKNYMFVRGEAGVYGLSNFQWTFLKDLQNPTRDQLIEIVKNHVTQVMSHFRGKAYLWNVVGEANPPSVLNLTNTGPYDPYWAIIGPDYVDIAFESARKADPSAILIYNGTRNEQSKGLHGKATQLTKDIANRLKSEGLLDGVGIQMHLDGSLPPDIPDLIQTLKSYGLPIYMTEFDVDMSKVPGTLEQKNKIEAQIYHDAFKACLDSGVCHDVHFWDTGDKYSWLVRNGGNPQAMPTMFDDDLKPKPAYFAVRDVLLGR